MEDINLAKQFSIRLREAMINAGYGSQRTISGISIEKLSKITNCSVQICRRYIRGETMPGLSTINIIANKLNISPRWLVFGDHSNVPNRVANNVTISVASLRHLIKTIIYLKNQINGDVYSTLIIELVNTLSWINGTDEHNNKIIDLVLAAKK